MTISKKIIECFARNIFAVSDGYLHSLKVSSCPTYSAPILIPILAMQITALSPSPPVWRNPRSYTCPPRLDEFFSLFPVTSPPPTPPLMSARGRTSFHYPVAVSPSHKYMQNHLRHRVFSFLTNEEALAQPSLLFRTHSRFSFLFSARGAFLILISRSPALPTTGSALHILGKSSFIWVLSSSSFSSTTFPVLVWFMERFHLSIIIF